MGMVNNEFGKYLVESVGTRIEALKKPTKYLSKDSRSLGCDLNLGPLESEALSTATSDRMSWFEDWNVVARQQILTEVTLASLCKRFARVPDASSKLRNVMYVSPCRLE